MLIHRIYHVIFKIWRHRRHEMFLELMGPRSTDHVIDIGGQPEIWLQNGVQVASVTSINIDCPSPGTVENIVSKPGDGRKLEEADQSFDIGYSNSVIEHVGDWEDQRAFASEIRRVARRLWIQTPAYECPIEPHFLFPFIHYLSPAWRRKLAPFTPWGLTTKPDPDEVDAFIQSIRLLSKPEMTSLFPDCEIITERLFGILPKSYIAIRR